MAVHVGITTQTPLLKFRPADAPASVPATREVDTGATRLLARTGGLQAQLTPGGVCRMVLPEVREWTHNGWLRKADWFSLQSNGPPTHDWDGLPLRLHQLSLPKEELAAYARTKEALWNSIHATADRPTFQAEDFRFYARYNAFTCDALLRECPDMDIAYVHDFQLLQMGGLVGLAAPAVFRWHVPFQPERIPRYVRQFLVRQMEAYDAVIVSTRRDLEGLLNARFRGTARQLYPAIDPREWPEVTAAQIAAVEAKWGLSPDDEVVLCVARMDPMKRQDVAIRALARIATRRPDAKLVVVGNGSFSGTANGGLGLSKSAVWRQRLETLAQELGVADRVIFTGFLGNDDLSVLYARCNANLLPSDVEGFGITVLEGWRYSRPCLVSTGAGSSEVIHDGLNGYRFTAGDDVQLADRLAKLLGRTELQEEMGRGGHIALREHEVKKAAPLLARVLDEAIERFGGA